MLLRMAAPSKGAPMRSSAAGLAGADVGAGAGWRN